MNNYSHSIISVLILIVFIYYMINCLFYSPHGWQWFYFAFISFFDFLLQIIDLDSFVLLRVILLLFQIFYSILWLSHFINNFLCLSSKFSMEFFCFPFLDFWFLSYISMILCPPSFYQFIWFASLTLLIAIYYLFILSPFIGKLTLFFILISLLHLRFLFT